MGIDHVRGGSKATPQPAATPVEPGPSQPATLGENVRSVFDKLSDAFDEAVGLDRRGPKPITLGDVGPEHFDRMEAKVAELERAERPLDDALRARLDSGDIVTSSLPRSDGLVEEVTQGVVDVPLEQFLQKIPGKDWGKNLVDWKGGEVKEAGPGRQIERMVLRAPGKDLDMTKVETIRDLRDASGKVTGIRVRWEVLKSDNGSVVQDVGTLRFERFGKKTLVTWHSAHKLDKFGMRSGLVPGPMADAATGLVLSDYFTRATKHYRSVAGASR